MLADCALSDDYVSEEICIQSGKDSDCMRAERWKERECKMENNSDRVEPNKVIRRRSCLSLVVGDHWPILIFFHYSLTRADRAKKRGISPFHSRTLIRRGSSSIGKLHNTYHNLSNKCKLSETTRLMILCVCRLRTVYSNIILLMRDSNIIKHTRYSINERTSLKNYHYIENIFYKTFTKMFTKYFI